MDESSLISLCKNNKDIYYFQYVGILKLEIATYLFIQSILMKVPILMIVNWDTHSLN